MSNLERIDKEYLTRVVQPDEARECCGAEEILTNEQHLRHLANQLGVPCYGFGSARIKVPLQSGEHIYQLIIGRNTPGEVDIQMCCYDDNIDWNKEAIPQGISYGFRTPPRFEVAPNSDVWQLLDQALADPYKSPHIVPESLHQGLFIEDGEVLRLMNIAAFQNVIKQRFEGIFDLEKLTDLLFPQPNNHDDIPLTIGGLRYSSSHEKKISAAFSRSEKDFFSSLKALHKKFISGKITDDQFEAESMRLLEKSWDERVSAQPIIEKIYQTNLGSSADPVKAVKRMVEKLASVHIYTAPWDYDKVKLTSDLEPILKKDMAQRRLLGIRYCLGLTMSEAADAGTINQIIQGVEKGQIRNVDIYIDITRHK